MNMQRTFNPFHSQYFFSNSPYCLLCKSYDINLENLVLDQTTIPLLIFFFILITCLLDAIWINSKEKFCLGQSWVGVKGSKQLYHGLCLWNCKNLAIIMFDTNCNFNFVNLKYMISSISFVAENVSL